MLWDWSLQESYKTGYRWLRRRSCLSPSVGFRKGRGCVDMIFATRQLVEKCREHDDSLFILFVDLQKA